ncbi:transglutaminase domain-containing protein [Flavobacterium sp. N1994]|uniref:transglutaminase domain-containing protein n=1 Tax=Flavobacterium sp. N1994 TaxID=2986827 RepID=UPI002223D831|nr:transglutaminase domain-containing protein [Flavobacterium sp. N1994]
MRLILVFSFLFLTQFSIGQTSEGYLNIDKTIAKIPDSLTTTTSKIASYITANFKTENEKIRAVYYWTASNISYDVPNMYEPNYLDSQQVKITNTLKSRKGVCIHYAEVFNDIANKAGIKTYIIGGYTKQLGVIATISHAWCASFIDGKWYMFDPTWGSGYVDGKKFVKKFNTTYFKVEPSKMIASHMPFDYLWQFLNAPLTNQEFVSGKSDAKKPKINFDYPSEIDKYEKLPDGEKAFEASKRIEKNGVLNNLISEQLKDKKNEFTVYNQNQNIEKLNGITANYNEAAASLNDFFIFKSKKFKPTQPDDILKKMITDIKDKLVTCRDEVYTVGAVGQQNINNLANLKKLILDALTQVAIEDKFVTEYLGKGLIGRKIMINTKN